MTGYLAQIKAASSEGPWTTKNVSQSTQSCLFTHLKPNSKYHVRVMAQDKMGYGWPSEVSKVSTIQAGDLRRKFVKCDSIRPTDSRSYYCLSNFKLISWVVRISPHLNYRRNSRKRPPLLFVKVLALLRLYSFTKIKLESLIKATIDKPIGTVAYENV